jgi:molecular chaperone DnaK (HSP70)
MQVVDHDGDNFLGGKDFDWLLVDWVARRLREERGLAHFDRASAEPGVRRAFAKLKAAAEDAKILLSRVPAATVQVDSLLDAVDCNVTVSRADYEQLIAPRVTRTIEIVRGLLSRNRVESSALEKLIFVGGPTLTPALRQAVEDALGTRAQAGVDPMTIVAQGETWRADRNRHIGTLEIPVEKLRRALPAQTEVEVTIEVDGSGTVRAQAYIALADQVFEAVVSISTPRADPEKLGQALWTERARLQKLRKSAAEAGAQDALALSRSCDDEVAELDLTLQAAQGGDVDAAQQAAAARDPSFAAAARKRRRKPSPGRRRRWPSGCATSSWPGSRTGRRSQPGCERAASALGPRRAIWKS